MAAVEPCDLHELTGCSICSGLDKKLAAEELAAEERRPFGSGLLTWGDAAALGSPPPGHFWAQYDGKCARCGEWFAAGTPLRSGPNGWIAVGCCE